MKITVVKHGLTYKIPHPDKDVYGNMTPYFGLEAELEDGELFSEACSKAKQIVSVEIDKYAKELVEKFSLNKGKK